jgi:WhiB family transcriptional regulator, redox-sensing transcriptional regulator
MIDWRDIDPRDIDWRDMAACRGADTELFFPIGTAGPALRQTDIAKAICHQCEVRVECLDWAMRHGASDGIWGGTTETERRTARQLTRPRVAAD